ncbi:MAG: DUF1311 domain-containing protein [Calothrix sp. SM1_7_51]|nr:DUF1311 domain-containing protein [Calothrix sp. SM1_7_51]
MPQWQMPKQMKSEKNPLVPSSALVINCNDIANITQQELDKCAEFSYKNVDSKLNNVYQQLLASTPEPRRRKLTSAQRVWMKFRQAACDYERTLSRAGNVAPTLYYGCLSKITDQRAQELQEYLQEGDK